MNRLSWRNLNPATSDEDQFIIYRDTVPFDADSKPAPLVTLDGTYETYDDETAIVGVYYYYMIEIVSEGESTFSGLSRSPLVGALLWDQLDELNQSNRAAQEGGSLILLEVKK